MKLTFDNLISEHTGQPVVLEIPELTQEQVEHYERIGEIAAQSGQEFLEQFGLPK